MAGNQPPRVSGETRRGERPGQRFVRKADAKALAAQTEKPVVFLEHKGIKTMSTGADRIMAQCY